MKDDEIEEKDDNYGIYSLGKAQAEPYVVDVLVSNESLKMEVDTGAAVSIMNEDTYTLLKKKHPNLELKESKVRLDTYMGEQVKVLGQVETSVKYEDQEGLKEDNNISVKVNKLLEKYEEVFHEELGTFSGRKTKIYVADDASPKYCKTRPVSYALRGKVEKELEKLQEEGAIEPVQFADWAAPIVSIVKDDKSIRIFLRVDDILVSGSNDEEHVANLEEVLKRLSDHGLRLKKKNCAFMVNEVMYLGQKINSQGMQPIQEKIRAITDATAPMNVSEVRSYMGMINYYQKYLPNL
ncbi:Hypothetical predicted protein [Paramuricea clavata]|uniref:Reverse transcriptase domain-containing protein n=1 Tax=Paramuricea clavata TaxID=317549 RepID=A0A6S7GK62_PARCT|nr:Hypothetical predicted protein [Paramuricea clavata]